MEENWQELLDQYMEFEDTEESLENSGHVNYRYHQEDVISLSDFVKFYFDDLDLDVKNLYHESFKKFELLYLRPSTFKMIYDNPQYLDNEYIVLVRDAHGKVAPYVNPMYLKNYIEDKVIYDEYLDLIVKLKKGSTSLDEFCTLMNRYLEITKLLEDYFEYGNKFKQFITNSNMDRTIRKMESDIAHKKEIEMKIGGNRND